MEKSHWFKQNRIIQCTLALQNVYCFHYNWAVSFHSAQRGPVTKFALLTKFQVGAWNVTLECSHPSLCLEQTEITTLLSCLRRTRLLPLHSDIRHNEVGQNTEPRWSSKTPSREQPLWRDGRIFSSILQWRRQTPSLTLQGYRLLPNAVHQNRTQVCICRNLGLYGSDS